ncbi:MAG TPA: class I SAM-dependent methyltransferase [Pyrinomonadaceae bacterium]|jgi:ubiquinone/menaquinone biosynthesis C-methylase UbiE
MRNFSEAEKQLLIAAGWLKSRYGLMSGFDAGSMANIENLRKFGEIWFGKYLVDWSAAFENLLNEDYLSETGGVFAPTEKGSLARKAVETENPLWLYEYDNFFEAATESRAHALFCEKVYGVNLCQHGLADVFQLKKLLEALRLSADERVLDLGCGNGFITEYLQSETGAFFHGVDISAEAIRQARDRTPNERLAFSVGNMNHLQIEPRAFDCAVSIDTLYYADNLEETLKQIVSILKPSTGRIGIFYTQWINNLAERENLLPENTYLAKLLEKYDLKFRALDLTVNETEHWRKKVEVLEELKPQFEREGNLNLYNYRYAEAARYANWDLAKRSRYLYHISLS